MSLPIAPSIFLLPSLCTPASLPSLFFFSLKRKEPSKPQIPKRLNLVRLKGKKCLNLVRRLKLLVPFLEEIRELDDKSVVSGLGLNSLANLKKALFGAKKLLKNYNYGSKIYLIIHVVMESEAMMCRFHAVYDKLNQALDDMSCDQLRVSVEVKEQDCQWPSENCSRSATWFDQNCICSPGYYFLA